MNSANANSALHSKKPEQDIVHTPNDIAYVLWRDVISQYVGPNDTILESAAGGCAFYDLFPVDRRDWCEIQPIDKCGSHLTPRDFMGLQGLGAAEDGNPADWVITNPPYSLLKEGWLERTCKMAKKGFAVITNNMNLTPTRYAKIEEQGFRLIHQHVFRLNNWFSVAFLCVYMNDHSDIPKNMTHFTYTSVEYKKDWLECKQPCQCCQLNVEESHLGPKGKNDTLQYSDTDSAIVPIGDILSYCNGLTRQKYMCGHTQCENAAVNSSSCQLCGCHVELCEGHPSYVGGKVLDLVRVGNNLTYPNRVLTTVVRGSSKRMARKAPTFSGSA